MKRYTLAILASLVCAPLAAQTAPPPLAPGQFAWQWPLDTAGADGVVRFALTPEIYAHISRSDLSDLAAFNAGDEAIPLGPAALAFERLKAAPPPEPVSVPWFRVPRTDPTASGERIELHISRGADGRLAQLDAAVGPTAGASSSDVLLDTSSLAQPVTALRLELGELPDAGLNARIEVSGSDDLAQWRPLANHLALVSLRDAGLTLERRVLELPVTELPYLRLRRSDSDAALPLREVFALPARRSDATTVEVLPPREHVELRGEPVADAPGHFVYRSAGPFPVEQIEVMLADANSVSGFMLDSRSSDNQPWLERSRGTVFRLGSNGDGVASAPSDLAQLRDTQWRLRTEPAQARAPTLKLTWRPDQFVLLTQGAAPYRLTAGSRDARRPDYPLRTVLSELRSRHGDLWLPPHASLGAGSPLAGDAALVAPPAPPPYKQWLLWGVLIAGALGVIGMVLKLMKSPPAE